MKQGKHYKCFSSFINQDVDLLELLFLDLDTLNETKIFRDRVFSRGQNYWKETVRVQVDYNKITLIENYPFDEDQIASKVISKNVLTKIINDWSLFLQTKNEFEKEYFHSL